MTEYLILLLFPALMAYAACTDLISMTISNRTSLMLVAGFLVVALAVGLPLVAIAWHLAIGAVVLVITFGMFSAGWIGGGDAKLAAATALWLGWQTSMEYGMIASIYGGVLTVLLMQFRAYPMPNFTLRVPWLVHLHQPTTGIPYGIALAAGGLTAYPDSPLWKIVAAS
jgi:prepilin peptidase CpaA